MQIEIDVKEKIATLKDPETVAVCGNSDYEIVFSFDEEWNEYAAKTARFRIGPEYMEVAFTGNVCFMPVIEDAYSVEIGVYAGDLHTTTPAYLPMSKSILSGSGTHTDPPEDVYDQIMEMLREDRIKGATYLPAVDDAGNISWSNDKDLPNPETTNIKGPRGRTGNAGRDGTNGVDGVDGITPHIGDNGNWYLADEDTGKPSRGIQGLPGSDGEDGEDGSDGASAYQQAVAGGYTGTEAEFMAILAHAATESYVDNHHDNTKQDIISDLDTIRSGSDAGSTALQPSVISTDIETDKTRDDKIPSVKAVFNGSVLGVSVAGTELTPDENRNVNVPLASKNAPGVAQFAPQFLISDNKIYIANSPNASVAQRVGNVPLTCNAIDGAVKAAMCDGVGAAWTAAEQKAARARIGEAQFELIEEITLTEEVATISRNAEPDGTPYDFRRVVASVSLPAAAGTNRTASFNVNFSGVPTYMGAGQTFSVINPLGHATYAFNVIADADISSGIVDGYIIGGYGNVLNSSNRSSSRSLVMGSSITSFGIAAQVSGSNVGIPSGTAIKIYAIRK